MKSSVAGRPGETNMTLPLLLRGVFAALVVVLLLVLGSPSAALAHDVVVGTSPASGATVAAMPENIEITLSNTPAVIGSQVLILDESGTDWASGEVDVLDAVATQSVRPGAPAGTYTVKWRLVSSDTHPIEDEFSFTATGASTARAGAAVGAGPAVSLQPQPESAPEPVKDESAVPWSVIGLGLVLLGLVAVLVVAARRRLGTEDQGTKD